MILAWLSSIFLFYTFDFFSFLFRFSSQYRKRFIFLNDICLIIRTNLFVARLLFLLFNLIDNFSKNVFRFRIADVNILHSIMSCNGHRWWDSGSNCKPMLMPINPIVSMDGAHERLISVQEQQYRIINHFPSQCKSKSAIVLSFTIIIELVMSDRKSVV